MMTLRAMLVHSPALFYPQTWYAKEAFLDARSESVLITPKGVERLGSTPSPGLDSLPQAVQLAAAYTADPTSPVWQWFHWTRDVDQHGNAVYVGGVDHDDIRGFQIHRHLKITNRWGCSKW